MLQNDIVAEFLTQEFNKVAEKYGRKIAIHDGAYDHDNFRAYINGIITLQSPEVLPIMNYVNMKCRYSLDFNLSLLGGFSRLNNINDIIDKVMLNINGKLIDIAGGQAIFMLRLPSTSDLQIREVIGQSVIPKVIVEVEYSIRTGGTKYQMALIDTVFDNGSVNTRWFASQTEQIEYYNNKVANGGAPYCDLMTPNLNSLTLNKQVYINDIRYYSQGTTKPLDESEILLKNYAIIRSLDETGQATSYYYYYITSATINSSNQISLDLQLDTVQTYCFNPNIEFSDCFISKAHLNRFIDNGDGTVSFDGTPNSKLFEREDIQNVSKRLINRQKLSLYKHVKNITNDVKNWLETNILGWVYIFLDPTHGYILKDENGDNVSDILFNSTKIFDINNLSGIDTKLCAGCAPILKEGKILKVKLNQSITSELIEITITKNSLDRLMDYNEGASHVYGMKFSAQPPFYNFNDSVTWEISNDGNTLFIGGSWAGYSTLTEGFTTGEDYLSGDIHVKIINVQSNLGMFYLENQTPSINTDITTDYKYKFNISEIKNSNKNVEFNPKLLSSDYATINIGCENGGFEYDPQKVNKNNMEILFTEPLSPDVTKNYIRYLGDDNSIFIQATSENFTGEVNSNDTSMTLTTTYYQQALANNKNFFLQNSINRVAGVANGLLSTGLNLVTGNFGAAVSSTVGMGTGLFSSFINEKLTVDNMKHAPSSIQNAKGNIFLNLMSSPIGVIVETYDILPNEKNIINDYMDLYGFTYNQIDNIKNVWNIRKYHNFIQANVENISGVSMSNTAREDIKQRFQNGIRFWNSDNIQYNLENYEIWMDD